MSVIPLPARLSDEAKAHSKQRTVLGTVNIRYGHRLSDQARYNINQPGVERSNSLRHGKSVNPEQHHKQKDDAERISIIPSGTKSSAFENNAKDEREYNSIVRTYNFVERTNKTILRKNIRHLVDEGLAAYEENNATRREKLRSMILSEETALAREIIDQAQRGAEWRMDEAIKHTQEMRNRLEEQRLATVATKRMQQYLAQCPEARLKFTEKTAREIKYSNLVQIAENEAKRQAEREVDELWYGLMLKEVEAKKAREIEEEKLRAATEKNVGMTLEKQIAGKLALTEEEKRVREEERTYLKGLAESVKQEELANHAREKSKRAELKKDLEEQLLVKKRCLAKRAQEEATIEKVFRELGEAELAKEKQAIRESTSRLRNEIFAYMKSLENLREDEARRDAQVEAVVEALAKEVAAKQDLDKQKTKEVRIRNLRELLEGREQQLRVKWLAHQEEYKRAEAEGELYRKQSEVEAALQAEAEAKRWEKAIRYGQELKAQQKCVEIMRQEENEKNVKILQLDLEREKEYQKLIEQQLNAPEIITPHAFKILLKECVARRDGKQKGLCYCPSTTAPQQLAQPPRLPPDGP